MRVYLQKRRAQNVKRSPKRVCRLHTHNNLNHRAELTWSAGTREAHVSDARRGRRHHAQVYRRGREFDGLTKNSHLRKRRVNLALSLSPSLTMRAE